MARTELATELLRYSELHFDERVYPRHAMSEPRVADFRRKKEAGAEFPPILVDAKTRIVVDGWHRAHADFRIGGEDAEIVCEVRSYKDLRTIFRAAVALNATHGTPLTKFDYVHCLAESKKLGVSMTNLAEDLVVHTGFLKQLWKERMGYDRANKPLPIKKNLSGSWAGRKLNARQQKINKKSAGMHLRHYIGQVLNLLESGTWNRDNVDLLSDMRKLRDELIALDL